MTESKDYEFIFQIQLLYYPSYGARLNLTYWRINDIIYLQNANQKIYLKKDYFTDMNNKRYRFDIKSQSLKSIYQQTNEKWPYNKISYLSQCFNFKQLVQYLKVNFDTDKQYIVQQIYQSRANYFVYEDQYLSIIQYIEVLHYYMPEIINLDFNDFYINLLPISDSSFLGAIIHTQLFEITPISFRNIDITFNYQQTSNYCKNIVLIGFRTVSLININFQLYYTYIVAQVFNFINICTTITQFYPQLFIQAKHIYFQNIYLTGGTNTGVFCMAIFNSQHISINIDNFSLNASDLTQYGLIQFTNIVQSVELNINHIVINNSILTYFYLIQVADKIEVNLRITNLQILNSQLLYGNFLYATNVHIENMVVNNLTIVGRSQPRFITAKNSLSLSNFKVVRSNFLNTSFLFIAKHMIINNGLIHDFYGQDQSWFLVHSESTTIIKNISFANSTQEDCSSPVILIQGNYSEIENIQFIRFVTRTSCQTFQIQSKIISIRHLYLKECVFYFTQLINVLQQQESESITQIFENFTMLNILLFDNNQTLPFVKIISILNTFVLQDINIQISMENIQTYLIDITAQVIVIQDTQIVIHNQQTDIQFIINSKVLEIYDLITSEILIIHLIDSNQLIQKTCYSVFIKIYRFDYLRVENNIIQVAYNFIQSIALNQDSMTLFVKNHFNSDKINVFQQTCYLIQAQNGQLIMNDILQLNSQCSLLNSTDQSIIGLYGIHATNLHRVACNYLNIESSQSKFFVYLGLQIELQNISIIKAKLNIHQNTLLSLSNQDSNIASLFISIMIYNEPEYLILSKLQLSQIEVSYSKISSLIYIYCLSNIIIRDVLIHNNHCDKSCLQLESLSKYRVTFYMLQFYQNRASSIMNLINTEAQLEGLTIYDTDADHLIVNIRVKYQSTLNNSQIYSNQYDCNPLNNFIIKHTSLYCWNAFNLNQEQLHLSLNQGRSYFRNIQINTHTYMIKIESQNIIRDQFYIPTGQLFNEYQRLFIENNTIQYKQYNLELQFKYQSKYGNMEKINCYLLTLIYNQGNNIMMKNQSFTLPEQKWNNFMIIASPKTIINFKVTCIIDSIPQILKFKGKVFDCQIGEILVNSTSCFVCDYPEYEYSVQKRSTYCKLIQSAKVISARYGNLELRPGFWRPSFFNDEIAECIVKQQSCLGGLQVDYFSCRIGYIGAICSQCDLYNIRGNGQFSTNMNRQCVLCNQDLISDGFRLAGIILTFQALLYISVSSYIKFWNRVQILKLTNRFHRILIKNDVDLLSVYLLFLFDYLNLFTSLLNLIPFEISYLGQLQIIIDQIQQIQILYQCLITKYIPCKELIYVDMLGFFLFSTYLIYIFMLINLPLQDRFKFMRIKLAVQYLLKTQLVKYSQKYLLDLSLNDV